MRLSFASLRRKGDGELKRDEPAPCQQQAFSQTKPKGNGQPIRTLGSLANGFGGVFLPQPEGVVFLPPEEVVFLPPQPEGLFLPKPEGGCFCPSRRGGCSCPSRREEAPRQSGDGADGAQSSNVDQRQGDPRNE